MTLVNTFQFIINSNRELQRCFSTTSCRKIYRKRGTLYNIFSRQHCRLQQRPMNFYDRCSCENRILHFNVIIPGYFVVLRYFLNIFYSIIIALHRAEIIEFPCYKISDLRKSTVITIISLLRLKNDFYKNMKL